MKYLISLPLLINMLIQNGQIYYKVLPHTNSTETSRKHSDQTKEWYNQIPPSMKLIIWKTRITNSEKLCDLNSDQREFTDSVANILSISMFESMTVATDLIMHKITERSIQLLGKPKAAFLFTTLGNSFDEYKYKNYVQQDTIKPDTTRLIKKESKSGKSGGNNGTCNCSTKSDFCTGLMVCTENYCSVREGCGLFWLYYCDGTCGF